MPDYNIQCKKCDYTKSVFCSYGKSEEIIKDGCPDCKNDSLYRAIGNVGIALKGTGWVGNNMVGKTNKKGY